MKFHGIFIFLLFFLSIFSFAGKPLSKQSELDATLLSKGDPKIYDKDFKFMFLEAQDFFNYEYYDEALTLFQKLLVKDTDNCNLNFYIGVCYLNSKKQMTKSIEYLEKAIKKTNIGYSYNYTETAAPVFAFLYLGQAYHLAGRFDEALVNFEKFKTYLTDKNKDGDLVNEVNHCIEMANFAKKLTVNQIKIKIEPFLAVNSTFSDYTPILSADGTQFYFTSKRQGNTGGEKDNFGEYYDDIYYSQNILGKWTKPKKMGFKINTENSEILSSISSDGNQFYFSCQTTETYDVFVSNFSKKNKWTVPQKLGPNINTKYNELYAFITSDKNTLFFASDKPGGYGGYDIYMSEKLSNGEWGILFNLGPDVNSKYDEICLVLMSDGTLYFNSNGHETMGGFDIFMTTISENGLWAKPENMGYPLNTVYDDINFIITSPDGKKGFYSSAKTGGYGESDIYEFTFE